MNAPSKIFPHLVGTLGFLAVVADTYLRTRARERAAWKAYAESRGLVRGDPDWEDAHVIWVEARSELRAENVRLSRELAEVTDLLERADEYVRVSQGLHKAQVLAEDQTVPVEVRASVLAHWLAQSYFPPPVPDTQREIEQQLYRYVLDRLTLSPGFAMEGFGA